MQSETYDREPTDEWTNYGDVNPDKHGGRFVRWDGDEWQVIETVPASSILPDADPDTDRHLVTVHGFQPSDVWTDGDPSEGFTETMQSILESLGDTHHEPDAPPFLDRVDYYVADLTGTRSGISDWESGDYWDIIESHGVDPDDIE